MLIHCNPFSSPPLLSRDRCGSNSYLWLLFTPPPLSVSYYCDVALIFGCSLLMSTPLSCHWLWYCSVSYIWFAVGSPPPGLTVMWLSSLAVHCSGPLLLSCHVTIWWGAVSYIGLAVGSPPPGLTMTCLSSLAVHCSGPLLLGCHMTMMWLCFIHLIGWQLPSSWTCCDVALMTNVALALMSDLLFSVQAPPPGLSRDCDVAQILISDWLPRSPPPGLSRDSDMVLILTSNCWSGSLQMAVTWLYF